MVMVSACRRQQKKAAKLTRKASPTSRARLQEILGSTSHALRFRQPCHIAACARALNAHRRQTGRFCTRMKYITRSKRSSKCRLRTKSARPTTARTAPGLCTTYNQVCHHGSQSRMPVYRSTSRLADVCDSGMIWPPPHAQCTRPIAHGPIGFRVQGSVLGCRV